jgi:hypothetical protein
MSMGVSTHTGRITLEGLEAHLGHDEEQQLDLKPEKENEEESSHNEETVTVEFDVAKNDQDREDTVATDTNDEDEDSEDNACPICMEPSDSMVAGSCQHSFCVSCLSSILKTDRKQKARARRRRRRQRQQRLLAGPVGGGGNWSRSSSIIITTEYNDADETVTRPYATTPRSQRQQTNYAGPCPLCRAELSLDQMTFVQDGSYLSDDESFQQELEGQRRELEQFEVDDDDEGATAGVEGVGLMSGIQRSHDGFEDDESSQTPEQRRHDRLVLSFCILLMFGMTILAILIQVRLANKSHRSDYYKEEDFLLDNQRSTVCAPQMPADCRDNGRHTCPVKQQQLLGTTIQSNPAVENEESAATPVTLNASHPIIRRSYPIQLASCSSTDLFTFALQKYAWATVVGTGGWIRARRSSTMVVPCNDTYLEVYLGEDCRESRGGFTSSCEFDQDCLVYNPDLWTVEWLSQQGVTYAIFDERRDTRLSSSSSSVATKKRDHEKEEDHWIELDFELLSDVATNQLCDNAVLLKPNAQQPYNFDPVPRIYPKPSHNICGWNGVPPANGLWFRTTGTGTNLTVSACSRNDETEHIMDNTVALLVLEGRQCKDLLNLKPGDNACIATLNLNATSAPAAVATSATQDESHSLQYDDDSANAAQCQWLTWETRNDQEYTIYLSTTTFSSGWYGEISVYSNP